MEEDLNKEQDKIFDEIEKLIDRGDFDNVSYTLEGWDSNFSYSQLLDYIKSNFILTRKDGSDDK